MSKTFWKCLAASRQVHLVRKETTVRDIMYVLGEAVCLVIVMIAVVLFLWYVGDLAPS